MASKIIYNVVAKTGSYVDREGNQKNRWTKCGIVLQNDQGQCSMKLEQLPVGMASEDGSAGLWFSLFEPDTNAGGQRPQQQRQDAFGHNVPNGQMPPPAMPQGAAVPQPEQAVAGAFQDKDIPF